MRACAEGKVWRRRRRRRRRLIWFDYCTTLPSTICLTRFLGIERQNKQTDKQTNKTLAECKHAHRRESRVLRLLHTQKSKEKKRKKNPVAKWRRRNEEQHGPTGNPQPRSNGGGEGDEKMELCANPLSPCASRNSCRVAAEKKNPLNPRISHELSLQSRTSRKRIEVHHLPSPAFFHKTTLRGCCGRRSVARLVARSISPVRQRTNIHVKLAADRPEISNVRKEEEEQQQQQQHLVGLMEKTVISVKHFCCFCCS